MVAISKCETLHKLGWKLLMQVHDEVIVEVAEGELDAATEVVREAMSGAFDLRVPLEINLSHGASWAAAKG